MFSAAWVASLAAVSFLSPTSFSAAFRALTALSSGPPWLGWLPWFLFFLAARASDEAKATSPQAATRRKACRERDMADLVWEDTILPPLDPLPDGKFRERADGLLALRRIQRLPIKDCHPLPRLAIFHR